MLVAGGIGCDKEPFPVLTPVPLVAVPPIPVPVFGFWLVAAPAGAAFFCCPFFPCCCCAEKSVLLAYRSCAILGVQGANSTVAVSRPAAKSFKPILLVMASPRCSDSSQLRCSDVLI